MNNEMEQALAQFNIDSNLPITQTTQNTSWRVGDKYILKSFLTDKENAKRIVYLNTLLYKENAPVTKYHMTKTGELYAIAGDNYYTLADKLPGKESQNSVYDGNSKKRAYSLGKNLAVLHLALKKVEGQVQAINMDTMGEFHGWILKEITEKKIAVPQELINCCLEFEELYYSLPRQLIHRDPHGGNIFFENDEVSGFIDFDISQINIRIFDMCYTFFPWKDRFTEWIVLQPYFFDGYNSISAISAEEMRGFPYMCVLLELLFVAFWSTLDKEDKVVEALESANWVYGIRSKIGF